MCIFHWISWIRMSYTYFVRVFVSPNTYFRCKKGQNDISRFSNIPSLCLMKDMWGAIKIPDCLVEEMYFTSVKPVRVSIPTFRFTPRNLTQRKGAYRQTVLPGSLGTFDNACWLETKKIMSHVQIAFRKSSVTGTYAQCLSKEGWTEKWKLLHAFTKTWRDAEGSLQTYICDISQPPISKVFTIFADAHTKATYGASVVSAKYEQRSTSTVAVSQTIPCDAGSYTNIVQCWKVFKSLVAVDYLTDYHYHGIMSIVLRRHWRK